VGNTRPSIAAICSGQVFSDTKIGCSSAIFRSKTLGDR